MTEYLLDCYIGINQRCLRWLLSYSTTHLLNLTSFSVTEISLGFSDIAQSQVRYLFRSAKRQLLLFFPAMFIFSNAHTSKFKALKQKLGSKHYTLMLARNIRKVQLSSVDVGRK